MKTEKANIRAVERQIEAEAKRMASHTMERRERARAKVEETKETIENSETRLKSFEDQAREKEEAAGEIQHEVGRFQTSLNQAKSRVQECEGQIKVAKDSEKNTLAPYGSGMDAVVKEVQNMSWHGRKPMGPLGRFVKLRDPRWVHVLRVNLSGVMVSWAITDAKDRAQLKALLERYGKYVARPLNDD
jgi:chromosome segregation ATPase